jgi:hypothetical protein
MRVESKATVTVRASSIWAVLKKLEWEKWDPDLLRIDDIKQLGQGKSLTYVMKGKRAYVSLSI